MFGLFLCLEKWFLVFITRLFLILLFNSVSLFFSFLMYPKIRTCILSWNVGKTVFCFLFLFSWFKNTFERINPFYFPLFWKLLLKSFFLFKKNHKKTQTKKTSFFVFVQFFFLFHIIFQHFSLFFHYYVLCSLFPFIFFFISFWLSLLFLFALFSILSLFLHLSVSLSLFSVSHVSLYFSSSPFLWIFFLFYLIFLLSLFCSWSHFSFAYFFFTLFYHLRICYFGPKKIKNFCGQFF